jgi:hypothetical protein
MDDKLLPADPARPRDGRLGLDQALAIRLDFELKVD